MPTYEYTCKRCGEHLEVVQSFTDKPLKKHAECGGELQKVFHARGVVFKGSGFYATDSRSSAKPAKAKETKETKDSTDTKEPKSSSNGSTKDAKSSSTTAKTTAKSSSSDSGD
jgi:putative FmdB family regulatory protein